MAKPRISVLIPAYNEEQSIAQCIHNVLNQQADTFELDAIYILNDGSSDATVKQAGTVIDKRVIIMDFPDRRGKAFRINTQTQTISSDLIIQIDADTTIENPRVFDELIKPFFLDPHVGLACADYIPLPPENFVQRIVGTSLDMFNTLKDYLGEKALRYRCNGRLICLRTSVAKKITIPGNVATDVFTFFAVIEQGEKVVFCPKAVIHYRLVNSFTDFIRQTKRYHKDNAKKYFPDLYKTYTTINFKVKILWFLRSLFTGKYPIHMLMLVAALHNIAYIASLGYKRGPLWPVSTSTKTLSQPHVT
jgi:glycosyltransferase involved in cell wall biosynthesis